MAAPAQLRSAKPPWVHLVVLEPGKKVESALAVPPEFAARTIDGRRGSTKRGLLAELARVFEFPAESGRNWDALEEQLADLEWLPAVGYLLIVTHAAELLSDDPADYETFIAIMKDVAREWGTGARGEPPRPPIPFHVCLVVPRGRVDARSNWLVPHLAI
jgi:hypothetical protein